MNGANAAAPRSRRPLWLLVALFFAPLLGAFWLYYASDWRGGRRTNHGELIEPPRRLPEPGAIGLQPPVAFTGHWSLVYVAADGCDADCRAALHVIRQTHAALGRLAPRVQEVLFAMPECCDAAFLAREHPALRRLDASVPGNAALRAALPHERLARGIFIVDPLGNLMMRYDTDQDPRGLLLDLRKLLQLSHIG